MYNINYGTMYDMYDIINYGTIYDMYDNIIIIMVLYMVCIIIINYGTIIYDV